MSDTVLVIGGGIAGIQASLDLAGSGARVIIVEREATIGGIMAVLDKNFPTLDCSICIEAPKMSEVELHPNIDIYSLAEVESIHGEAGDFTISIRQRSRFVTDECTRCADCTEACPVLLTNKFDAGLGSQKAIFSPIPQAIPGTYLIDIEHCLNSPPNYLPCDKCISACKPKAIDFHMPHHRTHTVNAGAIILSSGYSMLNPADISEYGYGTHPDILSALEFERLVNSAGPSAGEIICPSDGRHPESLLFVLCVGSRDQRFLRHCSRFCCMYSIKHAYQAIDHGISDITILYMDIRAYGKGFDSFWDRTRDGGAKFIRGRPSQIKGAQNGLLVTYEDIAAGRCHESEFDMVVLANAVTAPVGLEKLARKLGISIDEDGFVQVQECEGGLIVTTRTGIYTAGCVSGPKDIPDSVAEGSGAAGLALSHLSSRCWPEPEIQLGDKKGKVLDNQPRVGVFVCHCGSNIAGVIDVKKVVAFAEELPLVVHADDQMFSCAGNTQQDIAEVISRERINRVVIAACSPKTHESIFRGVLRRAGLNPYLVEMANIRNMNSWVHKNEPQMATRKAMDMVAMAVENVSRSRPMDPSLLPLNQTALVVGGGIAGMTAATSLARQGFETHLIEKKSHLGGNLDYLDQIAPTGGPAQDYLVSAALRLTNEDVHVHLESTIDAVSGYVGNFNLQLNDGRDLEAGALVIATGAAPYSPKEFNYGLDKRVITNLELESYLADRSTPGDRITFVSCVGSRQTGIGCSRYCCTATAYQALRLQRLGKSVNIISRDVRTYSRQAEELYASAMSSGVRYFRVDPFQPIQESVDYENGVLDFFDLDFRQKIRLSTDLLVLVVGLHPSSNGLDDQLKLARSEDGFLMELHPKLGPAETASPGIYLAGTVQGSKDVRESVAQGLAAAAKAGSLLSKGVIEKEPLTARVNLELCNGCMRCVKVCPYGAIEQIGRPGKGGEVRIVEAACMGCGTCAAECNFGAIDMPFFTREQILAQVDAALNVEPGSKCLVFTCNWCSYAGADLAGIEKRQYPTSARVIRTMCSARFEESFVDRAFEQGAGAVLITGCRLTETGSDCHYNYANRLTWKRFKYWQRKFRRKGIEPERLQLKWISAAEGKEFAEKIKEMDSVVKCHLADNGIKVAEV